MSREYETQGGVCVHVQECKVEMVHLCISILACVSQYMLACSYVFLCDIPISAHSYALGVRLSHRALASGCLPFLKVEL